MKVWDSEALGFIADDAVQCFGGYGFSAEYPPEKIYRDNRINRLFEGTNEINRMIIANQVFKKVGNGTLAFRRDAGDLPAFDGALGRAKTAVERAKRMLQFAVASALEVTGQKLIENQEASARAADMAMEVYTMESAVVRADKLIAAGDRWADFARDCAEVFANEGAPKVAAHARLFLAEVLEGEALDAALATLDAIALPAPVAGSVRRGRIADLLIEKGAYPIELF